MFHYKQLFVLVIRSILTVLFVAQPLIWVPHTEKDLPVMPTQQRLGLVRPVYQGTVFDPIEDTVLPGGTYTFDTVNIRTGVTVTITGSVLISVTGSLNIAGTLVGDCFDVALHAQEDITITGTIDNHCTGDTTDAGDLAIYTYGGSLQAGTLDEAATLQSSGNLDITNDPSLQKWEFDVLPHQRSSTLLPPACSASADNLVDTVFPVSATSTPLIPSTDVLFFGKGADPDGGPVTYRWDFGDGTSAAEQEPLHTYAAWGAYDVSLTVTDDDGQICQATLRVVLDDGETNFPEVPAVAVEPMDLVIAAGENVPFYAHAIDPQDHDLTYHWNFGDTTISSASYPTHTYNTPGYYTVTLTVVNTDTLDSTAIASVYVYETLENAYSLYLPYILRSYAGERLPAQANVVTQQTTSFIWNANVAIDPPKANTGQTGRSITLRSKGNCHIAAVLMAQHGGDGKTITGTSYQRGGRAGRGGSVRIFVAGSLTISNAQLISGDGGAGGNAESKAAPGDKAKALGGAGGRGGSIRITGSGRIIYSGAVTEHYGNGGKGGNATAYGGSGKAMCPNGGNGGLAWAKGGTGAHNSKVYVNTGNITGLANITLQGGRGGAGGNANAFGRDGGTADCKDEEAIGGKGGAAYAVGRRGGNANLSISKRVANQVNIDKSAFRAGDGGDATAWGGRGGSAIATPPGACAPATATGGDAGSATARGGKGGDGWHDGDGGDATAYGDLGGEATATGQDCGEMCGVTGGKATANGGRGGDAEAKVGRAGGTGASNGTGEATAWHGGTATATGGRGGDCPDEGECPAGDGKGFGGTGGEAVATGGDGGNATGNTLKKKGGDAGDATANGGAGGKGVTCCHPPRQGGRGGKGGKATASPAKPGTPGGASGAIKAKGSDGGNGGDGDPPGDGGEGEEPDGAPGDRGVDCSDLGMGIKDRPDPVNPGRKLGYTIALTTTCLTSVTQVVLTETYPVDTSFVWADPPPDQGDNIWNLGTLSACTTTEIAIQVLVRQDVPSGTVLLNTIMVDSAETEPITAEVKTRVVAADVPSVTVGTSIYVAQPNIGQTALYMPSAVKAYNGLSSYFAIQNLSSSTMPITLTFFADTGDLVYAVDKHIPSYSPWYLPLGEARGLRDGFRGAAVVTAPGPIAATDSQSGGGQSVAYSGFITGAKTLHAPTLYNNVYGMAHTYMDVQNVGIAPVTAYVTYSDGVTNSCHLEPAASCRFDQREEEGHGVYFLGSGRLTADQPLAAVIFTDIDPSSAYNQEPIYGHEAFSGGEQLVNVPFVAMAWDSNLGIHNLGNVDTNVTISYENYETDAYTVLIGAMESHYIYLPDQPELLLPQTYSGTVLFTSDNAPIAVESCLSVETSTPEYDDSGSYVAPPALGNELYYPLLPKAYTKGFGNTWYAALVVENTGTHSTTVSLKFYDEDGSIYLPPDLGHGRSNPFVLASGSSQLLYLPDIPNFLPDGKFYSAAVTAEQPIIGIAWLNGVDLDGDSRQVWKNAR